MATATVKLLDPDDAIPSEAQRSQKFERENVKETDSQYTFRARPSQRRLSLASEKAFTVALQPLFLGVAVAVGPGGRIDVGFASHDSTYSIDFSVASIHGVEYQNLGHEDTPDGEIKKRASVLADYFISRIRQYQHDNFYRFMGAGVSKELYAMSPQLPARMWWELDIVPLVFSTGLEHSPHRHQRASGADISELADSMARKAMMSFGINGQPHLQVGYRNEVEVDCGGLAQISYLDQYPQTVHKNTWEALMKYVNSVKEKDLHIAFFSSTPQGGGVALMRHAIIRFLRLLGVKVSWYVPKPKPHVFRITKNNHNMLQGVAAPDVDLTEDQKDELDSWVESNALRFWTHDEGPLAPRSEGGADVIIVDDHQMPSVVKIAKKLDPNRPVLFRDHIQVRSDLADQPDTPTAHVWNWVRDNIKEADVFISHPVPDSIPKNIDRHKIAYMPATTDPLDGLNKKLSTWDTRYYFRDINEECHKNQMNELDFPRRKYIVQIARFDPSKGIPHVLASYAEFRRKYMKDVGHDDAPQLVLAGHGAIDDPDMNAIYDQALDLLENKYSDIRKDVVVVRLGPSDQMLNVLMANARVALQLSTREGFEVKVSEASMKGVPIIGTNAGGIPLQIQHGKNGYLVDMGDADAVAQHLYDLFTDEELYQRVSKYAQSNVSDEVGTVGNTLCWLYLADVLTDGKRPEPNCRWIYDMARETANVPYANDETILPRAKELDLLKEGK